MFTPVWLACVNRISVTTTPTGAASHESNLESSWNWHQAMPNTGKILPRIFPTRVFQAPQMPVTLARRKPRPNCAAVYPRLREQQTSRPLTISMQCIEVVDVDSQRVRDPPPVKLDLLSLVLIIAFAFRVSRPVLASLCSQ